MDREIKMFIIYAREDKDVKLGLLRHLKPFREAYNLSIWHDDHIEPGQQWEPHIDSRLNQTDIFLLLVSVDFINSEFIKQVEFKAAIDRHKANQSIVVPVIIDYCQWDLDIDLKEYSFNLKELQVLPDEGKPIGDWKTPEQAFNNIAAGVRKVIITIQKNRGEQKVDTDKVDIAQDVKKEDDRPFVAEKKDEKQLPLKEKATSDKTRKLLGLKLSWVIVFLSIILFSFIIAAALVYLDDFLQMADNSMYWIFGTTMTFLYSVYIIRRKIKS